MHGRAAILTVIYRIKMIRHFCAAQPLVSRLSKMFGRRRGKSVKILAHRMAFVAVVAIIVARRPRWPVEIISARQHRHSSRPAIWPMSCVCGTQSTMPIPFWHGANWRAACAQCILTIDPPAPPDADKNMRAKQCKVSDNNRPRYVLDSNVVDWNWKTCLMFRSRWHVDVQCN